MQIMARGFSIITLLLLGQHFLFILGCFFLRNIPKTREFTHLRFDANICQTTGAHISVSELKDHKTKF